MITLQSEGILMKSPTGHHTWCASKEHADWLERACGWERLGFRTAREIRRLQLSGIRVQVQF